MKRVLAASIFLLASCGGPSAPPAETSAATPAASETPAPAPAMTGAPATVGARYKLKGEGSGCQDKAKAVPLVAAEARSDQTEALKLFGEGAMEGTCRGFPEGLDVTVQQADPDGWSCIVPTNDSTKPKCYWIAPGRAS